MDGTLWKASSASAKGWNKALEALGEEARVTAVDLESVAGKPYQECITSLLPNLSDKYPDLLETFNFHETESVKQYGGDFYEGVLEGIKELSKDYSVFVVSNCQDWYLKLFLKFSKLENVLVDYDCHGMSQVPKSEMIQNMKKKYSLEDTVYVGDTVWDEQAADLSNTKFIHVSYGFGKPEKDCISFANFSDLVNFFKNN